MLSKIIGKAMLVVGVIVFSNLGYFSAGTGVVFALVLLGYSFLADVMRGQRTPGYVMWSRGVMIAMPLSMCLLVINQIVDKEFLDVFVCAAIAYSAITFFGICLYIWGYIIGYPAYAAAGWLKDARAAGIHPVIDFLPPPINFDSEAVRRFGYDPLLQQCPVCNTQSCSQVCPTCGYGHVQHQTQVSHPAPGPYIPVDEN